MTGTGAGVVIVYLSTGRQIALDTRIIETDSREGYIEAVRVAARVLESGGLVGIPTETVYGIAASAEHREAIVRLREVKVRSEEKKFTICVGLKSDISRFAAAVPRTAEKLINVFWPGPLTIVLPGKADGTVGLRMPGLSITRDILLDADTAVVIPSANPHGEEPARTAGEVRAYFDGQIDVIIDGGPSRVGVPSTVVEVDAQGGYNILRRGAIGDDEIREALVRTILFVCTGNICRSPMAEGIARRMLAGRMGVEEEGLEGQGFRVMSCGTGAMMGSPPSKEAIEVMGEVGIDISGHRSLPLTDEIAREADDIFGMATHHVSAVRAVDSGAGERAKLMLPDGRDVADPIGQSVETYRRVRDELTDAIHRSLEEL